MSEMKKIMIIAIMAAAAASAMSCEREALISEESQNACLILRAGSADPTDPTRTGIDAETHVFWHPTDEIGVTDGLQTDGSNNTGVYEFKNTSTSESVTTTFSGEALSGTYYAFYPFSTSVSGFDTAGHGKKARINHSQSPTATSYDPAADILVSKPFTADSETTLVDIEFRRLVALAKIVIKDSDSQLRGEKLKTLEVTSEGENYIAGRAYIDFRESTLSELYSYRKNTVTASYTSTTAFEIDGNNAVWLCLYPNTQPSGAKLTFSGETMSGVTFSKTVTLPSAISFEEGVITTLNVSITKDLIKSDVLAKWVLEKGAVSDAFAAEFADPAAKNKTIGFGTNKNGGVCQMSATIGTGSIKFWQGDKSAYPGFGGLTKIFENAVPKVTGALKGDYWLFTASSSETVPAGTKINVRFASQTSSNNPIRDWNYEFYEDGEWKSASSTYNANGYNFAPAKTYKNADCTFTLGKDTKEIQFRLLCMSTIAISGTDYSNAGTSMSGNMRLCGYDSSDVGAITMQIVE